MNKELETVCMKQIGIMTIEEIIRLLVAATAERAARGQTECNDKRGSGELLEIRRKEG